MQTLLMKIVVFILYKDQFLYDSEIMQKIYMSLFVTSLWNLKRYARYLKYETSILISIDFVFWCFFIFSFFWCWVHYFILKFWICIIMLDCFLKLFLLTLRTDHVLFIYVSKLLCSSLLSSSTTKPGRRFLSSASQCRYSQFFKLVFFIFVALISNIFCVHFMSAFEFFKK